MTSVDCLLCRVRTRLCAVPLTQVLEVMRPLPTERIAGVPDFVRGMAVIRGEAVPVLDAASLLGAPPGTATRYVTLRIGERRVALAVDAVLGTFLVTAEVLRGVPPLLSAAEGAVTALGVLDSELLMVLEATRLLPHSFPSAIEERALDA
jgi:purine-binding chemotaxis protein CheW